MDTDDFTQQEIDTWMPSLFGAFGVDYRNASIDDHQAVRILAHSDH